ncbi:MAG: EMC3/TMCO1 family protein [Candidatus Micrarchaeia archaeon]|jgi:hypothetical protein
MFEEYFFLIVALLAISYSLLIRKLQYKFGNQKEMEELQKETKMVNEEYKQASKEKNQARMDSLMKKQQEIFPKMGKLMMGQFKVMGMILIIFLGLMWVVNYMDPFTKDDIKIILLDDGANCDSIANDNIYSACYLLNSKTTGSWAVTINAYENGNMFSQNSTYFIYNGKHNPPLYLEVKGEPMEISLDKLNYLEGEEVKITAKPSKKADLIEATLNNGTWFYVDLPFSIPVLEIKRIHQPYWWFITITILIGLIITPIYRKIKGDMHAKAKK